MICLHSTEDDLFVAICSGCAFEYWFESHAGSTTWRPKVDDNARIVSYDCLKLHKRGYLADFSKLWRRLLCLVLLGTLSTALITTILLSYLSLCQHLNHLKCLWVAGEHLCDLGRDLAVVRNDLINHLLHRWVVSEHLFDFRRDFIVLTILSSILFLFFAILASFSDS